MRLVAGPVWPWLVTPGLTTARRTRVQLSWPRTVTPRARVHPMVPEAVRRPRSGPPRPHKGRRGAWRVMARALSSTRPRMIREARARLARPVTRPPIPWRGTATLFTRISTLRGKLTWRAWAGAVPGRLANLARAWQKRLPGKAQQAQVTPVSAMIPLLQPPRGKKQPNHLRPQNPRPSRQPPPPHPTPPLPPNGGRGERRPHENPHGGHPPSPPNGHTPQKERGVDEGEAQGGQLPKKPRRGAEGLEAQREGQSLKGVSYGAHYRGASSKTLPTAPDQSLQMSQVTSA